MYDKQYAGLCLTNRMLICDAEFHVFTSMITMVTIIRDGMSCTRIEVHRYFGEADFFIAAYFLLVACLDYFPTLKIEALCSYEMPVHF
jgi:hypothetical protein